MTRKNLTHNYIAHNYTGKKVFIGIDVHLKKYAVTAVCDRQVEKKWVMPANGLELVNTLRRQYPGAEIHSVYEAGFSGFVLHRTLTEKGINNMVVNPSSVAISSGDRVKTDRRDSEKLALHLSAGLLQDKKVYVPTLEMEYARQPSRLRQQLIKDRTRVMVQIRRRLYHFGYAICIDRKLSYREVEELVAKFPKTGELRFCIESHLDGWKNIDQRIKKTDERLAIQAEHCPLEELYRSVPGIGRITSRILATELGDMSFLHSAKALFKYVGLTPVEFSSADRIRRGHISRQGKPLLRKVLTEAAWVAIRKDPNLLKYYQSLKKKDKQKIAIVAVARKLVGRTRAILKAKGVYKMAA